MKLSKNKKPIVNNTIYFDLYLDTYIIGSYTIDESQLENITPRCILEYINDHFNDFIFSYTEKDRTVENVMWLKKIQVQIPNLRFGKGTSYYHLQVANIHRL